MLQYTLIWEQLELLLAVKPTLSSNLTQQIGLHTQGRTKRVFLITFYSSACLRKWNIMASQIECDKNYHAPQVSILMSALRNILTVISIFM